MTKSPWLANAATDATGKTYEIRTVADFLKVPEERRRICLREFNAWLTLIVAVPDLLVAAGASKDSIALREPDVFRWRDDGKATMSVEIIESEQK